MKFAASLFLIAGLIVAGLTTPVRRTVTEVEADIVVISSQATAFKSAAGASPSGTLAWALGVHSSVVTLVGGINTGTTHIKTTEGPVSSTDGRVIVDGVKAFIKIIVDGLAFLVANKPTPSPVGGILALILQDIKDLAAALTAYIQGLVALLPPDLASELSGAKNTLDTAVTKAITTYS